jgi:hypothetical protein
MNYFKHHQPNHDTAIATTVRLPLETLRRVDFYCDEKQISRSALFRRLIAAYSPLKNHQPKSSGAIAARR